MVHEDTIMLLICGRLVQLLANYLLSRHYFLVIQDRFLEFFLQNVLESPVLEILKKDIEQLWCVIRILGTPTEETWPQLPSLPDYKKIQFAETKAQGNFKNNLNLAISSF